MLLDGAFMLGCIRRLNNRGRLRMTTTDMSGNAATWGVGSVIGTAVSTLFGHFVPFVGTALVASLPSLVFAIAVPESKLQSIVNLVINEIVAVTLVYGAVQALRGRQVPMAECLSQGLNRLGAVLGVAILSGLGIAFGMVLLIVPGLILATMWAVAIPIAVVEKMGVTASLSRSSALTRERRWRVFGAIFVSGLLALVVGAAFGGLFYALTGGGVTLIMLVSWAVGAIFQAFNACVVATLYFFLRRDKEGVDIHQIAAVFD
jgi:hypothetical protein